MTSWRRQLSLLVGAVLWLLAVLALVTHDAADAAFSTSGLAQAPLNKAGQAGAWFSDLAFFVFGYSVWWAVLVALRAWLSAFASVLRVWLAGQARLGAWVSLTVTVKVQRLVLLAASVACQMTEVVPFGKAVPLVPPLMWSRPAPAQLSE